MVKIFNRKEQLEITNKKKNSEENIRKYAYLEIDKVYSDFETSIEGLTNEAAGERQEEYGKNLITVGNKENTLTRILDSIINPFNIVLLCIAFISFITDVLITKNKDYVTIIIILALVLISSAISFIQSERSNAAAEKLSKMISNKVNVLRNGTFGEINLEDVVCGDIVKLSAGDMIPADVRFISAKDAFISQSALTGESNPVEKFSVIKNNENSALTDLSNIGFMGSNMVSGSSTVLVLAIGNDTYFGAMAKTLSGDKAKNSFERGVDSVSKLLIRFMLVMIPIIFIINGFTKGDWIGSLLFSVTIAIGLMPEMLPVIMTSTLAKGAINMSKHETIVKTLGAIQTFGEMDILCTDKTGTLTEDKIILEKYINVRGEDDTRVLRHAYLNSYFQTGLKNLIDIAIINRGNTNGLNDVLDKYNCIDEIPFDFSRRRMSVVLRDKNSKDQLITKGAVEEIISICSHVEYDGEIFPLNDEYKKKAMEIYEKNNYDGLRVIAIAQKNDIVNTSAFGVNDESNMVLIGFIGFLDPPKESSKVAINALKENGVRVVVLTGDSEGVALKVCKKVDIDVSHCITGLEVEKMSDEQLKEEVKVCNLFAKLSPNQKERVVKSFQDMGHTVGYLGDGINDAPSLHQADVGISVDTAVDIAKETADIILLKKDLMVLEEGVIEGRKTFGNIVKYIKMAASGNFGNMISVMIASIFLPFLPMLPVQILTQNLLCDFSQMGIPFDDVDKEYTLRPRKWETKSIKIFMSVLGPLSSLFDILCFIVMWWVIKANTKELAPLFQCGWFVFGTVSQILVFYMIRTMKIPFIQSKASIPIYLSTGLVTIIVFIIGFTSFASGIDMMTLPIKFMPWLLLILFAYFITVQLFKGIYIRIFKEWL